MDKALFDELCSITDMLITYEGDVTPETQAFLREVITRLDALIDRAVETTGLALRMEGEGEEE